MYSRHWSACSTDPRPTQTYPMRSPSFRGVILPGWQAGAMPFPTLSKVKSARSPFANRDSLLWEDGTTARRATGSAPRRCSSTADRGEPADTRPMRPDPPERLLLASNRSRSAARFARVERPRGHAAPARTPSLPGVDRRGLPCSLPVASSLRERRRERT